AVGRSWGTNCVASRTSLFFCASASLRPRALRPQLKRDPLGGALPPRRHPSANSFGMVTRGALSAQTHGRLAARRAPPLQGRHARGAPRTSSDTRGCPEATSQGVLARPSVEAHGALEHR